MFMITNNDSESKSRYFSLVSVSLYVDYPNIKPCPVLTKRHANISIIGASIVLGFFGKVMQLCYTRCITKTFRALDSLCQAETDSHVVLAHDQSVETA